MLRTDGGYGVPGMPGNHAGVRDLVYRGEPVQAMPMPYYGGGMNVKYGPLKPKPTSPAGPQLPNFLNRGVRGAYLPTGFDAKYVS